MIRKIKKNIRNYLIVWSSKIQALLKIDSHSVLNLSGDRDIEWEWIVSQIPSGKGDALDFGSGDGHLGLIAARKGFNVTSIDLRPAHWDFSHPNLKFIQGDILKLTLPEKYFDLVINCSAIEHVGLSGRYGVIENNTDGDIEAMTCLRQLMKPGGIMLLTIPVGKDAVYSPLHRVYGMKRLPELIKGYTIEKKEYWIKNDRNHWILTKEKDALNKESQEYLYGLGCFVLRNKEVKLLC